MGIYGTVNNACCSCYNSFDMIVDIFFLALGLERDLEFVSLKASNILNKNWNKGKWVENIR